MSIATTERLPANGAAPRPVPQKAIVQDHGQFSGLMDTARFEHCWRVAQMFASSTIVPDQFRNQPANCFIAIHMAMRCKTDPFMFLQKCYVVHGRPAIETQLAVALANSSGVFKTRISYKLEGKGDDRQCTASAVTADNGERVEQVVTVKIAKEMGWWGKKDSLWPRMTDLMLQYRSAMWLIRTNAPEVLMGMLSKEEAQDVGRDPDAIDVASFVPQTLDDMAARLEGQQQPTPEESSEQLKAEAEKLQEPETQEANPLADLHDNLTNCTSEADVDTVLGHYASEGLSDEEMKTVADECLRRRKELKPKSPARGAAKQSGLPLGQGNQP